MEAIQIVRIEHINDGYGLFRSEDGFGFNIDRLSCNDELNIRHGKMLNPNGEGLNLYKHDKEWFCAYKNIEQFSNWIDKDWVEEILSVGFDIYLLSVTEYQIGRDQVIFTKESIIKKEIINSLFI
jgi:hypothetical protein